MVAEQRRGMALGGFPQVKGLETEMPFLIATPWIHFCKDQILIDTPQPVLCRATSAELKCCREVGVTGDTITREMVGAQ